MTIVADGALAEVLHAALRLHFEQLLVGPPALVGRRCVSLVEDVKLGALEEVVMVQVHHELMLLRGGRHPIVIGLLR